jgi:hypothetical protein
MAQIFFNGKSYNSVDEMPANEKQTYEQMMGMFVDKNGNGIPDFLEGDLVKNISNIYSASQSIRFDGNTYTNYDQLPPEVQAKVKSAFSQMAGMGFIQPNNYEEHTNKYTVHNDDYIKQTPFVSREYNPVIQEEGSSNFKTWLIAGIVIMACLGIMAVAVFAFMFL